MLKSKMKEMSFKAMKCRVVDAEGGGGFSCFYYFKIISLDITT